MIKSWEEFETIFTSFFVLYNGRVFKMIDFLFRVQQFHLEIDAFKIKRIDYVQGIIFLE